MSNFLTGLIKRAGNRMPLLERRPRALFEPVVPRRPESVIADSEMEPAQAAAVAAERSVERIQVQHVSLLRELRAVPFQAERSMPPPDRSADAPPESLRIDADRETPRPLVEPRSAVRIEAPAPRPASQPAESRGAILRAESPPPSPRVTTTPPQAVAPAIEARIAEPPANSLQNPPQRHPETAPAVHVVAPAKPREPMVATSPMLRPAVQRERAPAVLLARAQSAVKTPSVAVAAPAPIQISIGRVEVRAGTHAAEPQPRVAKPAAPQLKLEDYLRQRSGGRR